MAKSRKRTNRTPKQWQRLITEFEAGHQGPEEFCRKHGLGSNRFYHWRRKFRNQGTAAVDDSAGPLVDFVELPPVSPKAAPERAPAGDGDWRVELDLGGGMVLRVR